MKTEKRQQRLQLSGTNKQRSPRPPKGCFFWLLYRDVLNSVKWATARLHVIKVSGSLGFRELTEQLRMAGLGGLKDLTEKKWIEAYDRMYVSRNEHFILSFFCNPNEWRPPSYVAIRPTKDLTPQDTNAMLQQVKEALPGYKVSSVEYAVDIFCETPDLCRDLFCLLRRCLYVPYARSVNGLGGEQVAELGSRDKLRNIAVRYDDHDKVYERGPDDSKDEDGWDEEDIDRVRLEHTAERKNKKLMKHGIDTIEDLIVAPRFLAICGNRWRLTQFTKEGLPKIYEKYPTPDDSGSFTGCFQSEFIAARKNGCLRNTTQSMKDVGKLSTLNRQIVDAMSDFDTAWAGL